MPRGKPFAKGDSRINLSGRPKEAVHVRDLARQYTEDAINTLAEIMKDQGQPGAARTAASSALLDRGWGKATQPLSGDAEGAPIRVVWEGE
jgi:hypothetical protein